MSVCWDAPLAGHLWSQGYCTKEWKFYLTPPSKAGQNPLHAASSTHKFQGEEHAYKFV